MLATIGSLCSWLLLLLAVYKRLCTWLQTTTHYILRRENSNGLQKSWLHLQSPCSIYSYPNHFIPGSSNGQNRSVETIPHYSNLGSTRTCNPREGRAMASLWDVLGDLPDYRQLTRSLNKWAGSSVPWCTSTEFLLWQPGLLMHQ